MSNTQKPKTERKTEGRTEEHWLNKLVADRMKNGRKVNGVVDQVRSSLIRAARDFAKKCLEFIPTRSNQLNTQSILLAACNCFDVRVGAEIQKQIEAALERVEAAEKKETDGRQYADDKSGLLSVSDCKSILQEVTKRNRNAAGNQYTLVKMAKYAFAAVVNALATEFADEIYTQHEKVDPKHEHMITIESVYAAEEVLGKEGMLKVVEVRARGTHKRRRIEKIEAVATKKVQKV